MTAIVEWYHNFDSIRIALSSFGKTSTKWIRISCFDHCALKSVFEFTIFPHFVFLLTMQTYSHFLIWFRIAVYVEFVIAAVKWWSIKADSEWWSLLTVFIVYCLNLSSFGFRICLLLYSMHISHSLNNYLGLFCDFLTLHHLGDGLPSLVITKVSMMVNICNILQNHLGSNLNDTICVFLLMQYLNEMEIYLLWLKFHQLADAILWSLRNQQCYFLHI